jgi:hypothetical protein
MKSKPFGVGEFLSLALATVAGLKLVAFDRVLVITVGVIPFFTT